MSSPFEQAQQFTQLWTDLATRMLSAGLSYDPAAAPPETARRVRGAVFQALGESADQYMRSPQFLQMTKQSLDGAIALRKQWTEVFTQCLHAGEAVARRDVDDVMRSLRQVESRVVDRLEDVCGQLDEAGEKLDALGRRLDALNGRLGGLEDRLEKVEKLEERLGRQLREVRNEVRDDAGADAKAAGKGAHKDGK